MINNDLRRESMRHCDRYDVCVKDTFYEDLQFCGFYVPIDTNRDIHLPRKLAGLIGMRPYLEAFD